MKNKITEEDYSELRDYILFDIELDTEFNSLFDFCYMLLNDGYNDKVNDNIKKFFDYMNKFRFNISKTVYLLKDIANWHKFVTIKDSYKVVDWTSMHEFSDNTKHNEMYTCAGGACELK